MPVGQDPSPLFQQFASPEKLVSADWVAEHLDDPSVVIVESDEDVLLYETGHIPGAVKVDWHSDLNDPLVRDYLSPERFAELLSRKGISRDHTVVFYGDNFNWWAAYALWVFTLFGHPDTRLMDGGRQKWVADGRPMTTEVPQRTPTTYPTVNRDDKPDGQPGRQTGASVPRRGVQALRSRWQTGRCPIAAGVPGRAAAHARLPAGGGPARRPHSRCGQRALEAGGQRGRHLQVS
jgi:3-mercaptopyruvate sulfurtransferase SseA